MAEKIRIETPFTVEQSKKLKAGDSVLITGTIISARDAAHKVMCEALARGEKLPVDWKNEIVYYLGPTPAKPGDPIGSCGPTTAGRMDAYSPRLIREGLKVMIGKGLRNAEVVDALKQYTGVFFAAIGGAAALMARCVDTAEVIAFDDLGPEAIRRLTVTELPVIVAIDCQGRNVYETGRAAYEQD